MPEIDISLLEFRSNTPPTTSAEEIGEYVSKVAPHGGITPAQIQRLSADVLNLPYEQIKDGWTRQPLSLTLAGIVPGEDDEMITHDERQRLTQLEEKVARIATDELRESGFDGHVSARMFSLPKVEGDE